MQIYVRENSVWIPFCGCWLWTEKFFPDGYGRTKKFRGKRYRAHRLSYLAFRGPIPEGMLVCHSCDTPPCVNPEHLWLGTVAENVQDMVAKGRIDKRKLSEIHIGKKHSVDTKKKMSESRKKWHARKRILIHDPTLLY